MEEENGHIARIARRKSGKKEKNTEWWDRWTCYVFSTWHVQRWTMTVCCRSFSPDWRSSDNNTVMLKCKDLTGFSNLSGLCSLQVTVSHEKTLPNWRSPSYSLWALWTLWFKKMALSRKYKIFLNSIYHSNYRLHIEDLLRWFVTSISTISRSTLLIMNRISWYSFE